MHASFRVSRLRAVSSLLLTSLAVLGTSQAAAVNVDVDCAAAYGSSFAPVTGQVTVTTPSRPRPLKGVLQRDPSFGSCVIRATDHAVEPPTDFARNDYSRRQAFNADNTKFIVYANGGGWHLYDARTLVYIKQLTAMSGDAEPQWDTTDPNSLYYIPSKGGMTLSKLNVSTNTGVVVANFTSRLPWAGAARVWSHGEGSPSADGRYWCFVAETSSAGILGVFTYDLQTQTVLGTKSLTSSPDYVSMSPSGKYCVISGTVAWNQTFTASKTLLNGSQHSDLAIGANGNDHYVFVDHGGNGYLSMVDLETGLRTSLLPTWINGSTTSSHVSGKAFSRPGWVLLSTFAHTGTEAWLHQRVMAVELKASPKIINLAHHHGYNNGYWSQQHATVSRDFSRVNFNSNWGSTSSMDIDTYMIRLSDNTFGVPAGDTTKPVVSAAESGSSGTISLSASATDNVGVKSVDFMVDGVYTGSDTTAPYSLGMASSGLSNGTHSLVALAYDAATNTGTSATVSFAINNTTGTGPDVTAPNVTASVALSGGSLTMKAVANDNVGVSRVEFWMDGVYKGRDTTSPYAMYLNTRSWKRGSSHTLVAKAYDAAGNIRASTPVVFTR